MLVVTPFRIIVNMPSLLKQALDLEIACSQFIQGFTSTGVNLLGS